MTLEAFCEAFATIGYERCFDDGFEPAFEKVAIFVDQSGVPSHAARQLPTGKRTSKLGRMEDIEHELRALEGGAYGSVAHALGAGLRLRRKA